MPREKLSVIIITRNEEKKIRRCLNALRWVDEIVIIDQSSTDSTAQICREYTSDLFIVPPKGYCEPDRKVAVEKTRNSWILYLDADEVVSPELRAEIESVLSDEKRHNAYYLPRKNIFMDKWIRGSGWYPGYVLRLFKKGYARFSDDIHDDIAPVASYGYLRNPIIHYTCENLEEYIYKMNSYTSILAEQNYAKGARIKPVNRILKLIIVPFAYATDKFFLKMGFIDGFHGVMIAFLTFLTVYMMNAKLWEIQKGKKQVRG